MTGKFARIADVALPVRTWNPSTEGRDGTFPYIDLRAVDNELKTVTAIRDVLFSEAPSRARQLVASQDILVSRVRPNLNGVAFLNSEHDGATASTGFCVLRVNRERAEPNYIFQWVKSPNFIEDMVRKATGANYPAVRDRIVLGSEIPLPPLAEQRRIAAILDQAEALRRKRREAGGRLKQLIASYFLDIFGDPFQNPKDWPVIRLGRAGQLDRGISKHRPRNDPALLDGPYPLVQTGDIANCDGYIREYRSTYSELGLRKSKLWPAGTLCITIAANIGKVGVLEFEACFPDSVVGFKPADDFNTEFVREWFNFLQPILERDAPQSAQKNVNLAILRDLEIIKPPLDLQRAFAARAAEINALRAAHRAHLQQLDALFGTLQQSAFRGNLSTAFSRSNLELIF